jgi:hypothetical protein
LTPDLLRLAAHLAILGSPSDDTFTLQDLSTSVLCFHCNILSILTQISLSHNISEHDASVTRSDLNLGDNTSFNETLFNTFLAQSNPGVDFYNITSASQVMKARLDDSKARNPFIVNTFKELEMRGIESALYLAVMGDAITGVANKSYVSPYYNY